MPRRNPQPGGKSGQALKGRYTVEQGRESRPTHGKLIDLLKVFAIFSRLEQ